MTGTKNKIKIMQKEGMKEEKKKGKMNDRKKN